MNNQIPDLFLHTICMKLAPNQCELFEHLYFHRGETVTISQLNRKLITKGMDVNDANNARRAVRDTLKALQERLCSEKVKEIQKRFNLNLTLEIQQDPAGGPNHYRLKVEKSLFEAPTGALIPNRKGITFEIRGERITIPLWVIAKHRSYLHVATPLVSPILLSSALEHVDEFRDYVQDFWARQPRKDPDTASVGVVSWDLEGPENSSVSIQTQKIWKNEYRAALQILRTKPGEDSRCDKLRPAIYRMYHEGNYFLAPLAVNVLIHTADGKVLLAQQNPGHSVSAGEWVATVSGVIDLHTENHQDQNPTDSSPFPEQTARFETYEEIGLQIYQEQIQWVAFAMGITYGQGALLAEVDYPSSFVQIHEQEYPHRKDPLEVSTLDFVNFDQQAILEILKGKSKPHRTYFKLALCLALWRKHLAEIVEES